ncbi:MAG TPA: hypothetical protein PKA41_14515 [Verrucomicrobiota bacterium]|nr:hypothetical protein [Verrucomicrobiota bacterium]
MRLELQPSLAAENRALRALITARGPADDDGTSKGAVIKALPNLNGHEFNLAAVHALVPSVPKPTIACCLGDLNGVRIKRTRRGFYRNLVALLLCAFALNAAAAQVKIAWDASATNVTYVVYASTNSFASGIIEPQVRVNVGTNLSFTADFPMRGRWYFVVTAQRDHVQSLPSNELIVEAPTPPANTRTLAVEYTPVITGTNWQDAGFFRIKIQ